jgi:hypothetical protein
MDPWPLAKQKRAPNPSNTENEAKKEENKVLHEV